MGDAGGAVSAKVRPIKKIALSLPPQKNPAPATETVYAPAEQESQSGKEFVSADFDRIMNTPPPVYDGEKAAEETDVSAEKQLAAAAVAAPAKEATKKGSFR